MMARVAERHQRVGAQAALRRHDEDVRREPRQPLAQLAEDRLTRRREAADLRRVHADQQLQIGPRREVLARLHEPLEHVRKRVGRVVQLRVPGHVGEQADHRLRRVEADLRRRSPADPASSGDGTRSSRTALRGGCRGTASARVPAPAISSSVLPVLARLAQQRVVIRVVVAEDEPPLAVGDVPGRHVHAFLPRDLADDTPRHVDAVREDRRRELDRRAAGAAWRTPSAAPTRDTGAGSASAMRLIVERRRWRRTAARRRARARRWPGRRA